MKPTVLLLTFFVILLIMTNKTNAQIAENYFNDTEIKEGGKVNDYIKGGDYIIIGGKSFDNYPGQPSVMKIDTLGNVIWSTTSNDFSTYTYSDVYVERIFMSSGYIYALIIMNSSSDDPKEIWKIDATNGGILWKKEFYSGYFQLPQYFIDYDNSKFLIGYYESSGKPKFAFISKLSGDTLSTHLIGNSSNLNFGLAIDSDLNIYYSYRDSIFKTNGMNPDNIYWRNALPPSSDIVDFLNIYIDSNDSIYLFSRYDDFYSSDGRGKVIALNSSNGSLLWESNAPGSEIDFVSFIDKNGYIYSTWRHAFVGGGSFGFWTTKMNKTSGNIEWNSIYHFSGVGSPDSHSGSGSAAMSIDVDYNGDVYLTGYYGDANYGPENWGILKLNGTNGTAIYEKTITEDSIMYDDISNGMAACMINNKPYFLGDLQTFHSNYYVRSKATIIKLDGSSGDILLKKYIGGSYQFPAKTLYIENYAMSKTIVMKQSGRLIKLEAYDFNKNIIWEKSISKDYYLYGGNLSIVPNGEIFVSAYSKSKSSTLPFYKTRTDSIYLFHLDNTGNIIKEYSFYIGVDNAFPIELHADSMNTLLFYQKNNVIYYRKISSSTLSSEYNSQISYFNVVSRTKYCFNTNSEKALLFGNKSGTNRLVELDKNSMNTIDLAVIPTQLFTINYTLEIDTNLVVLCGKNNSNRESIGLYNTSVKDTIWTKILSVTNNSQVLGCVTDNQKEFIYLISHNANNVIVRKLAVSNGLESWVYTFNGTANLNDSPIDIAFDNQRGRVIVSGFETELSNDKNVLIIILDSLGSVINTIQKTGDFVGDNYALCSHILPDGSIWVGGNLNKNPYGLAGFIFEIDSSLNTSVINFIQPQELGVMVFPNPFSEQTTLHINNSIKNAKLILYNSNGAMVKEINCINEQTIILQRGTLPTGLYLIQLTDDNNLIMRGKILITE